MGLKQGKIQTSNFKYYNGKKDIVVFRSSWELMAFEKLEKLGSIGVISGWSSEDVVIPYKSDIDDQVHRYFIDLKVETKDSIVLVEIKPSGETFIPPKPKVFKTEAHKRNYEQKLLTCIKNQNKWKYTLQYCARMSQITGVPWNFQIWTEKVHKISDGKNQGLLESKNPFVKQIFNV